MSEYLGPILTGEQIKGGLIQRSKQLEFKTIRFYDEESLQKAIEGEEKEDGWTVVKKKKTKKSKKKAKKTKKSKKKAKKKYSARLARPKPTDELLENEVWAILARMGFDEVSEGRQFKISVGPDKEKRQIDVFAKDEETAILVECTHCETLQKSPKKISKLIEKIVSIRKNVANSINKHYGKNPKLKLRWVIATRNIIWGEADLIKASSENIIILIDEDIDYYKKLSAYLKKAAKYQLSEHIFENEDIHGLDIEVPATREKTAGKYLYHFLVDPLQLLKISYVGQRASRNSETLETYQRLLVPSRLKKIASYIDSGGTFPTNIVINFKINQNLKFDRKDKVGNSEFGTLYLPSKYASAWVIDGQHRLYGFAHAKKSLSWTVPVLAYANLPSEKEVKLFIDINSKQVRVKKSLLLDIYSELHWDSDDANLKYNAILAKIVKSLNNSGDSPLYNRINISEANTKDSYRNLQFTSINDGLKDNKLVGSPSQNIIVPGPISKQSKDFGKATLKKSVEVLSGYLDLFASEPNLKEHWDLGDAQGGYLCTNYAIRALFRVLKEICVHLNNKGISCENLSADELLGEISDYVLPIVEFFSTATSHQINGFRTQYGGGQSGVKNQAMAMMVHVNSKRKSFKPDGLDEFIDSWDEKRGQEVTSLSDKIEGLFNKTIISVLKKHFNKGSNEWWFEGVPKNVRTAVDNKRDDDKEQYGREAYFDLIHYKTIIEKNYSLFQELFIFDNNGGKEKRLKWMQELNDIRKKVAHKTGKGAFSKDEFEFVKKVYETFSTRLA